MAVNTANIKDKLQEKAEKQLSTQVDTSFQGLLTRELSKQFKAIQSLVPKHVTPERLCRIGLNAVSRNLKLLECAPETIVGAIVNCASMGLEPNLLGHAYIVPFWNGSTKRFEAQFQVGYKGALDLIRRTGEVSSISAHEVYEGDTFEYSYGLDEKLKHIPSGEDDESKITHFYAAYKLKDGGSGFIVMSRVQMEKHRDRFTKSKDKHGNVFGPWKDHFVSMALKTVILRLIKYMPISIEKEENKQILETLQRDNAVNVVKEPSLNFGDSYIESNYIVSDEPKEEEQKTEAGSPENEFAGTSLE